MFVNAAIVNVRDIVFLAQILQQIIVIDDFTIINLLIMLEAATFSAQAFTSSISFSIFVAT